MNPIEIIGIVSALVTLCAFILNQYNYLTNDDVRYDALNFIASIGLFAYALSTHAIPFIITNTVWAMVSGIDVVRFFLRRSRAGK